MRKILLIIPLVFAAFAAFVACDDDEEVNGSDRAGNPTMSVNSTSLVGGQTLTVTIAYTDDAIHSGSPFVIYFTAINTATTQDASSLFTRFTEHITFDPSEGTVSVDYPVAEMDDTYTVRFTASATNHDLNDAQRTITLREGNVEQGTEHIVALSITSGATALNEGSAFSITATADAAPETDLSIEVNVDESSAAYVSELPTTITIAAGETTGVSDELTMVDDGGAILDNMTIRFVGTASDEAYAVTPVSVIRVDTDEYVEPSLTDETTVYEKPGVPFYSSNLQNLYMNTDLYTNVGGTLMTKYDYTSDTDGDPHPNSTLAAQGWTLLNACEFHPVGDGWGYPRSAENSNGLHPVAVANGWGAQNTDGVQVRSYVDNTKFTNVTDDGILRMWSCLDSDGQSISYGGETVTRYCGTSAIYANKPNGNYVCNNTFIGEGTRVEIRARLCGELVGFLPALWLQGNNTSETWPEYGEIDILENHPYENDEDSWGHMYQTLHWGYVTSGESPTHANPDVETTGIDADAWNIYWVEILGDEVKMGINGVTTKTFTASDNPTNHTYNWPFCDSYSTQGFHILVTQGVAWNAASMSTADLKAGKYGTTTFQNMTYEESKTSDNAPRIEIDWIRYWKNDDYTYPSAGFIQSNGAAALMY